MDPEKPTLPALAAAPRSESLLAPDPPTSAQPVPEPPDPAGPRTAGRTRSSVTGRPGLGLAGRLDIRRQQASLHEAIADLTTETPSARPGPAAVPSKPLAAGPTPPPASLPPPRPS
jgi:hypothetical protein